MILYVIILLILYENNYCKCRIYVLYILLTCACTLSSLFKFCIRIYYFFFIGSCTSFYSKQMMTLLQTLLIIIVNYCFYKVLSDAYACSGVFRYSRAMRTTARSRANRHSCSTLDVFYNSQSHGGKKKQNNFYKINIFFIQWSKFV